MRLISLFLALVSLLSVASAQSLEERENDLFEKGQASDPLYGNKPARTMSQREYSEFYERQVVHPAISEGALMGAIALNLQTGEISICEKAPEPSSLSLLVVGGMAMLFMKRKRSW
jgi:hypothetical protein